MLSGTNITLLITGSIAAYKSAELVRELVKKGAHVNVAMSRAACEFITPLTMQTLSGSVVTTDLFDAEREAEIDHIALADSADIVLVAPASADVIAKAAHGIADDTASTILLASKAPKLFAPAMNVNMWENPLTQKNVQTLIAHGVSFVEPEVGELACGWFGSGRFAQIDRIIDNIEKILTPDDLRGSRVVVAAGPTVEAIDPIRFVSNRSTGKMGYALARVAAWSGADVHLISGPTQLTRPDGVAFTQVESAQEMRDAVFHAATSDADEGALAKKQFIFMAAAVTDHRPKEASATKVKNPKGESYAMTMVPCPDILSELGAKRVEIETQSKLVLKLIGFSAETGDDEQLLTWAREKLERKNADLMVGNSACDSFGKDTNRVWLLDRGGRQEEVATADKLDIAKKIIKAALRA